MEVSVHLVFYGFHHARVAMTDVGDSNSGDEIQVSRTVWAIQPASLCTVDRNGERRWRSLCEAMKKYLAVEVWGHAERSQKKAPAETAEAYH